MENRKRYSSSSEDRGPVSRRMTVTRASDPEHVKSKDREKYKNSYIPVLKGEKIDAGKNCKIQRKCASYSKIHRKEPSICERMSELDEKLKLLEEKEKSVAEYYRKVQDLVNKYVANPDDENCNEQSEHVRTSISKKKSSDAKCNGSNVKQDFLSDFELYVQQISDIWLATSSDFYSAMKNLKSCSSIHPMEFEIENVKIQLAIKQAKSLTLAKTRNVIEEVKKLLQHREIIRAELEKLLNNNDLKLVCGKCESVKIVPEKVLEECSEKLSKLGTGDSYKDTTEDQESISGSSCSNDSKKDKVPPGRRTTRFSERNLYFEEKEKSSGETEGTESLSQSPGEESTGKVKSVQSWAKEVARKNETITNLNSKIFRLQKTFNEQSLKCNELQVKLSECQEKTQWNQVLWKQIGKLKEQIRGLQQSNKQLEAQKKELEARLTRLDLEIERLIKMNEVLNKKKFLLSTQMDCYKAEEDCCRKQQQERKLPDDKAVAEKQNAITQLRTILNIMTDQKNLAQQQICLYQSKIEELEKMLRRNNVL